MEQPWAGSTLNHHYNNHYHHNHGCHHQVTISIGIISIKSVFIIKLIKNSGSNGTNYIYGVWQTKMFGTKKGLFERNYIWKTSNIKRWNTISCPDHYTCRSLYMQRVETVNQLGLWSSLCISVCAEDCETVRTMKQSGPWSSHGCYVYSPKASVFTLVVKLGIYNEILTFW